MKIIFCGLVEHTSGDALMHSVEYTEHLGVECLGAVLQEAGHEVILQNFFDLEQIRQEKPKMVGFSVMTFQDSLVRKLAQDVKAVDSKIITVVGGPHPSGYPSIVMDQNIDYAVIGEGERTIVELAEYFQKRRRKECLQGLAYKRKGKLFITEPQLFVEDLDTLPWAIRNKEVLSVAKTNPGEYGSDGEVQPCSAQIYYSRGCPFGCNFCNAALMSGKAVRFRSPERVVQEIAYIQRTFNISHFTFTDLTFNLNRGCVLALCEEIKKQRLDVKWFSLCSPAIEDFEDVYPVMASAGWSRGGWGLETTVRERRRLGKAGNWLTITRTLKLCDWLGVMNRVYIMLGGWETIDDIGEIQNMLYELAESDCIDDLKITFSIPFPDTALWNEWQSGFLSDDFSHWTTEEPILYNPHFTAEQYLEIRRKIARVFFNSDVYRRHCDNKMRRFPHLRRPFENLWERLRSSGLYE